MAESKPPNLTIQFIAGAGLSLIGSFTTVALIVAIGEAMRPQSGSSGFTLAFIVATMVFAVEVWFGSTMLERGWRGFLPGLIAGFLLICMIPLSLCAMFPFHHSP